MEDFLGLGFDGDEVVGLEDFGVEVVQLLHVLGLRDLDGDSGELTQGSALAVAELEGLGRDWDSLVIIYLRVKDLLLLFESGGCR